MALWYLVADVHVAAHGQAVPVATAPQTEGLRSLTELRLLHAKHPDVEQLVQESCTQCTQTQQSWIVVASGRRVEPSGGPFALTLAQGGGGRVAPGVDDVIVAVDGAAQGHLRRSTDNQRGPIAAQLQPLQEALSHHLVHKVVHGDDGGWLAWVAVDKEAAPTHRHTHSGNSSHSAVQTFFMMGHSGFDYLTEVPEWFSATPQRKRNECRNIWGHVEKLSIENNRVTHKKP